MNKKFFLWIAIFVSFSFNFASANSSEIYIKVGEANVKKSLLALPPFQYTGSTSTSSYLQIGRTLYNVVEFDLDVSSYFEFVRPAAYIEDPSSTAPRPAPGVANGFKFENWKKIGTDFLIRATYNVIGSEITLETYVYSINSANLILGRKYTGGINDARKIAHSFTNDIIKSLTGKDGIFNSKILYTSDRQVKPAKEIFYADWDMYNPKQVTRHNSISISPAWSHDGQSIAYTSFAFHKNLNSRNADVFTYDISSGKRFLVSSHKGINSGANFTPDGKKILLTISKDGNPDIYIADTDGKNLKALTKGPLGALNVEPATSPDGTKIAFSSNRSGSPMIFVMGIDGSNPQRRTFAGTYNASPAWSPDGKKIAFSGRDNKAVDIFIMDNDGTNLVRLTSAKKRNGQAAKNEYPSFSPDGRHIVFVSDRDGNRQLYIVNTDGSNERRITFDKHNYDTPRWK